MHRRHLPIVVLAALIAVSAGCGGSDKKVEPTIVEQVGIAGINVGMTRLEVRSLLGQPTKQTRGSNDFGPFVEYRYGDLRIGFQGAQKVTDISTSRQLDRTRSGIGPGSTRDELKKQLPKAVCKREFGYDHCYLGKWAPGKRITDFAMEQDRVSRVVVGTVID